MTTLAWTLWVLAGGIGLARLVFSLFQYLNKRGQPKKKVVRNSILITSVIAASVYIIGLAVVVDESRESGLRLFLSGVYDYSTGPKSDFELKSRGRTLLLVMIPEIPSLPANRFVFSTFLLRPMNIGSVSLIDTKLTMIYDNLLWDERLGELEETLVVSMTDDIVFEAKQVNNSWIVVRDLPRLDLHKAYPFQVSFILDVRGSLSVGDYSHQAKGDIEIRMTGPDWVGLSHTLSVHGIASASVEDFRDKGRHLVRAMIEAGEAVSHVVVAGPGGGDPIPPIMENGPTIYHAKIEEFMQFGSGSLEDFLQ